jgi:hypothetical protein
LYLLAPPEQLSVVVPPLEGLAVDRFEVRLYPPLADCPAERRPYRQAHIAINSRPLIDLLREAEEPWARAEYLERLPQFENPDEFRFDSGNYHYLPASLLLLPSRELLGRPRDPGFVLEPDDPRRAKATVLGCTCGIIACWFLQVRIELRQELVVWSEFGQFHRPHWRYDLGPFTFDRRQYETQLAPQAEPSATAEGGDVVFFRFVAPSVVVSASRPSPPAAVIRHSPFAS